MCDVGVSSQHSDKETNLEVNLEVLTAVICMAISRSVANVTHTVEEHHHVECSLWQQWCKRENTAWGRQRGPGSSPKARDLSSHMCLCVLENQLALTGNSVQCAKGEFAPGCDGWRPRRGRGVGGRWRRPGRHGEATISTYLVEHLTPRSLRPEWADL